VTTDFQPERAVARAQAEAASALYIATALQAVITALFAAMPSSERADILKKARTILSPANPTEAQQVALGLVQEWAGKA
jgi:hypothetical protein